MTAVEVEEVTLPDIKVQCERDKCTREADWWLAAECGHGQYFCDPCEKEFRILWAKTNRAMWTMYHLTGTTTFECNRCGQVVMPDWHWPATRI